MQHAIITKALGKRYKGRTTDALHDLNIQVDAGEVYGFLGANGAGKSTTIRLLLNFIRPTHGSGQILGQDIVRCSVSIKRSIGYLAGDVALYDAMTGEQFLNYMQQLQGGSAPLRKQLVHDFNADTKSPIHTLSKGNRQKIGIIQALMHRPKVLIMDEPTSGLDPLMQEVFYESIKAARNDGAAVFMSSHNLNEAQLLCDRIGIIRAGSVIRQATIDELTAATTGHIYTIGFRSAVPSGATRIAHTTVLNKTEHSITLQVTGSLPHFLQCISTFPVASLESKLVDIETAFLQFYEAAP